MGPILPPAPLATLLAADGGCGHPRSRRPRPTRSTPPSALRRATCRSPPVVAPPMKPPREVNRPRLLDPAGAQHRPLAGRPGVGLEAVVAGLDLGLGALERIAPAAPGSRSAGHPSRSSGCRIPPETQRGHRERPRARLGGKRSCRILNWFACLAIRPGLMSRSRVISGRRRRTPSPVPSPRPLPLLLAP